MAEQEVGFESEIRPLFREKDVESMSAKFDLSSYDDVKASADAILGAVSGGSMPCDGAMATGTGRAVPRLGGCRLPTLGPHLRVSLYAVR